MEYSDDYLRAILSETKTVAMVGVSTNPVRPSYFVGRYLDLRGFRVLPVNPVHQGERLFGAKIAPSLEKLAKKAGEVHMVDIFRRSEYAGAVVDEALEHLLAKGLRTIWMQIGVRDDAAAKRAETAGLRVVMDRCPKIECQRLRGELSIGGFNSGRLSSRLGHGMV